MNNISKEMEEAMKNDYTLENMALIVLLAFFAFSSIGCADNGFKYVEGPAGIDGRDGRDGVDGSAPIVVTSVNVPDGQCVQIAQNIWAENIHNGEIFDVYYNDQCKDSLGEYCDNVVPSEGSTGSVNPYQGSGTVCWADNYQISGSRDGNDILVRVIEFL